MNPIPEDALHNESELILLNRIIGANYQTVKAFCDVIKMTPQNLNHIKRKATANGGNLDDDFKLRLKGCDIDLYQYQRRPTGDFVNVKRVEQPGDVLIDKEKLNTLLESHVNFMRVVSEILVKYDQTG